MMLRGIASILCLAAVTLASSAPESGEARSPASAAFPAPAPLPFFYDLYTFRADGGGTAVVAAIAVRVRRLQREWRDDRYRYRFDVRFVLADTARRSVVRTDDSVFVEMRRPLARQHLLHTYVEVQAPPSDATVQRVVVTDATRPGTGQLYRSPFPIPDYSGTELMLSDVAFGLPGAEEGWTRNGVTLALLPTSQFPESAFDVYYEVYNLPTGNPYDTEIAIQPLDDDSEERIVRAVFSGESAAGPDGTLPELRRVESALPEGRYRLTVTVRDLVSLQAASSSRLVDVRGWGRGTTLVRAMPHRPNAQ